jgi:hypothetical protein
MKWCLLTHKICEKQKPADGSQYCVETILKNIKKLIPTILNHVNNGTVKQKKETSYENDLYK